MTRVRVRKDLIRETDRDRRVTLTAHVRLAIRVAAQVSKRTVRVRKARKAISRVQVIRVVPVPVPEPAVSVARSIRVDVKR